MNFDTQSLGLEARPTRDATEVLINTLAAFDIISARTGYPWLRRPFRISSRFNPALRAGAGGDLRLLPVWIVRAALGQVDFTRLGLL